MSWDTIEKRIKCPCGKGEIVQVNKDNDWGQYIEGTLLSDVLNALGNIDSCQTYILHISLVTAVGPTIT